MRDDTFFARLYLKQESELGTNLIEIDARPSDSIAIAIQQKCEIYVHRKVWEQTEDMSWALKQATSEAEAEDDEDEMF